MRSSSLNLLLIVFFSIYFQSDLLGQDAIKIKRLTAPVEFDGRPFEEAWNGLEYFPMTMFKPDWKAEPVEKSEVMITYDDKYVYVGARLFMSDASQICN